MQSHTMELPRLIEIGEKNIGDFGEFLKSLNKPKKVSLICGTNVQKVLKVKIEKSFSRAAKGGVGYAKAAGNYAAQFYPTILARNEGYQQIIWTDSSNHEYIEEAGAMNIFIRINDTLITAPTNDRILDGITRKSIIEIAKAEGITVEVRPAATTDVQVEVFAALV